MAVLLLLMLLRLFEALWLLLLLAVELLAVFELLLFVAANGGG